MNTYELTVTARCPINPDIVDIYSATIESIDVVPVENILEVFRNKQEITLFQEDLCKYAANQLGAKVILVGVHSGVKTTSVYDCAS